MATYEDHLAMITTVAKAMGPNLCNEVAFVGGCTTGLLLTDNYTRQQARHTDDVDLIVHVISQAGWHALMEKLRGRGFKEEIQEDGPICAMYLDGLRVDFMPDDASILNFTNVWYKDAFANATPFYLGDSITIRLVRPEYFVATKLEAYLSRGNNDPLGSRDVEDILILLDGRPELTTELLNAPKVMRKYISEQFRSLLKARDFDYAVQAAANGNGSREDFIFERINLTVSYGNLE